MTTLNPLRLCWRATAIVPKGMQAENPDGLITAPSGFQRNLKNCPEQAVVVFFS